MARLTKRERNSDGTGIAKFDVTTVDDSLTKAGRNILTKLADYEDLEEQGLLVRLPVKIGDDIYKIPSKANYDLNVLNGYEANNRVYHQKAYSIVFSQSGWFVQCDKDSIHAPNVICVDVEYGKTWFLTHIEAEKKLKEMEKNA